MPIVERMEHTASGGEKRRVLLPTIDELGEKIRAIPIGTTRKLTHIGAELAQEQGADLTCPVAMLRQLKVIAVIAHSSVAMKDAAAVPFWRVLGEDDENLAEKLAGGHRFSVAQRMREQRSV